MMETSSSVDETVQRSNQRDRTIDSRKSPALWRISNSENSCSIVPTECNNNQQNPRKIQATSSVKNDVLLAAQQLQQKGPPELMSPAGGWPQLVAAVVNGADAIYLGLTSYSARARATNFDPNPMLIYEDDDDGHDEGEDDDHFMTMKKDALGKRLELARGGKQKSSSSTKKHKKNNNNNNNNNDNNEATATDAAPSLAKAVKYCHEHHVRVYVAFNTLVFDNELHEVEELVNQIWDCGVDAVIVQDVGVAKIIQSVINRRKSMLLQTDTGTTGSIVVSVGQGLYGLPLEIHASTQQTVTCVDGVEFAAQYTNAARVVVGRELSLADIAAIASNTNIEIEAFVHGALCVSYSGQCFSSEAWGGRSANRGQCAQACRLPYGLIANGELKHLSFDGIEGIMGKTIRRENGGGGGVGGNDNGEHDEIQYLLSPQDLCGLEQVEGLVRAGVSCLKIEGRLKDASYVAATTRAYRQAIDAVWDKLMKEHGGTINSSSCLSRRRILSSPDESVSRYDLTHVFARGQDEVHDGFTPGFFDGPQHQRLVRGRSPRHRGVHVGRVISSNGGAITIQLDDKYTAEDMPLKRGDGVVIDRGMPQEKELGGPVYDVLYQLGNAVTIRFGRDVERQWKENDQRFSLTMVPVGSHVWKTSDYDILKRMQRLAELDPPKSPAKVVIEGRVGDPLTVSIIDERTGLVGMASSLMLGSLVKAEGPAINEKSITKAVGSLGNSRWSRSEIDLSRLEEGLFCPMSWVKDTRRRALDDLKNVIEGSMTITSTVDLLSRKSNLDPVVDRLLDDISGLEHNIPSTRLAKISVLARNFDQVEAICSLIEQVDMDCKRPIVSEVIVDFLEIEGIRSAVARIRDAQANTSHGLRVVVASPRIIKPGEEGIWQTLLTTNPDGILIRSTGLLHRLMQLGGTGQRILITNAEEEAIEVTIPELIGDFSLNAANAITAYEYLQSGLSRITASYDLSGNAITELASLLGNNSTQLDVILHTHMPIFHTEHCVFARFLSKGNSYLDCGHVCTRNTVHLRDQNGNDNLVLADMGCRNTVFSAESQTGVFSMNDWVRAGVGNLRIELVDEIGIDATKIVNSYLKFLSKELQASDVWDRLKVIPDSNGRFGGVGFGSLRNAAERRSGAVTSNVH